MYVGRQQLILAYFGVVSTSFKHGTKVVFEHLATFDIEVDYIKMWSNFRQVTLDLL